MIADSCLSPITPPLFCSPRLALRVFNLPALQRAKLACLLQSAIELDKFESATAEDEVCKANQRCLGLFICVVLPPFFCAASCLISMFSNALPPFCLTLEPLVPRASRKPSEKRHRVSGPDPVPPAVRRYL
jgi:hypothetical protein